MTVQDEKKPTPRRKTWSEEEVEFVRSKYAVWNDGEIGRALGRSAVSVKRARTRYGIERTEEQKTAVRRRVDQSGANNGNWKGGVSKDNMRYKKRQIDRYPERVEARNIAWTALQKGLLVKRPCEVCNNPDTQMHHDNYNKPLEVKWLCKSCHKNLHIQRGDWGRLAA